MADLGNTGTLTPESLARAAGRRAARHAGGDRADIVYLEELADALVAREKAGEPLPLLDEAAIADLFTHGGSTSAPMLLSALVRQQSKRAERGRLQLGHAPRAGRASEALSGDGQCVRQLRALLPHAGTAHGAPRPVR